MVGLDTNLLHLVRSIFGRGDLVKYDGSLSSQENRQEPVENTRIRFQTTVDAEDADVCLNCTLPHCNGSEECYQERKREKEKRK